MPADAPAGAGPGEPLLTVSELAVWVREPIAADDAFAEQIIWAASLKVRDTCHADWSAVTVPETVKLITLQLAKRSYVNDRGVVAEGSLGPIGGDRFLDDYARTLQFLPEELRTLEAYGADDVSTADGGQGTLFTISTAGNAPVDGEQYRFAVDENGNASDWAIPFLAAEDAWIGRP